MVQTKPFIDRQDAGRQLARKLHGYERDDLLVLGLPRGGIPVAAQIALALNAPLQPMFVKKIGAPNQPELAIGAVADGASPTIILNDRTAHLFGPDDDYVRQQTAIKLSEIEQRREDYLGNEPPIDPAGRAVIVVDDGIATGSTARAALEILARAHPAQLILAVPVLPRASVQTFEAMVDALVYIQAPVSLGSVGEHYHDFRQVDDDIVRDLLARHPVRDFQAEAPQKAGSR